MQLQKGRKRKREESSGNDKKAEQIGRKKGKKIVVNKVDKEKDKVKVADLPDNKVDESLSIWDSPASDPSLDVSFCEDDEEDPILFIYKKVKFPPRKNNRGKQNAQNKERSTVSKEALAYARDCTFKHIVSVELTDRYAAVVFVANGQEWTVPVRQFRKAELQKYFMYKLFTDLELFLIPAELDEAIHEAKNFHPEEYRLAEDYAAAGYAVRTEWEAEYWKVEAETKTRIAEERKRIKEENPNNNNILGLIDRSAVLSKVVYLSPPSRPSVDSKALKEIRSKFREIAPEENYDDDEHFYELSTNSLTWLEAVFSCTRYGVKIREELKITVDSLQTLKPGKRINKLAMDSVLELVCRETKGTGDEFLSMGSEFIGCLESNLPEISHERYAHILSMFKHTPQDLRPCVFVPIQWPSRHWSLVLINTQYYTMCFLDSMNKFTLSRWPDMMETLVTFFEVALPESEKKWTTYQRNSTQLTHENLRSGDCGAFVILNAMSIALEGNIPNYTDWPEKANLVRYTAVIQLVEDNIRASLYDDL